MVQTQIEQLTKVQKDLLDNASRENDKHAFGIETRGGASTQDPLYPKGHLMHVKCIHELCIILFIFPSYLHHIRVISMIYNDFGNNSQVPLFFWN